MKVYTYYEEINHSLQREMIDLWKHSWESNGFDAIVLDYNTIASHPLVEKYTDTFQKMNMILAGREISKYGMSCWFRWLAYSTLDNRDTPVYTCDYDVINVQYSTNHKPISALHFMDNRCPCFVSGTPDQFTQLCELFVEVCENQSHDLKQSFDNFPQCPNLHDQDFLICASSIIFPGFKSGETYCTQYKKLQIQLSPRHHVVPYSQHDHTTELIHFSHSRCGNNENRIKYIREVLRVDRS